MKFLKPILIAIVIFFVCLAIVKFLSIPVVGEEEDFGAEYHVDFIISYDFSTTTDVVMSSTVAQSPCAWCLKNLTPTQCLVFCGNKIIYE